RNESAGDRRRRKGICAERKIYFYAMAVNGNIITPCLPVSFWLLSFCLPFSSRRISSPRFFSWLSFWLWLFLLSLPRLLPFSSCASWVWSAGREARRRGS